MYTKSQRRTIELALVAVLGLFLSLTVHAYAQSQKSAALNDVIEGAKKETTLRAQWSSTTLGGSKGLQKIVDAMNKKYGTNIKAEFTPGPNMQGMMTKIAREAAAGQPASSDVYFGNPQSMLQATDTNALKPMDWRALFERPLPSEPDFDPIAPGGIGVAMASTLVGVTYNTDLVKGDDIPKKLADTLKPKWKGKIASTPYAAGMREFAMPELLGKEAIVEFTKKLSQQIGGLMRCGELDRITSGEFLMLVLSCGNQDVTLLRRSGAPVGYTLMDDATISHTRYAGVPKNSHSPNAAALFIAFLHTPEGQKLLWDVDAYDLHLYPESHQKKELDAARARGAKVVVSSPQWLGKNKDYRATQALLEKILRGESS